MSLKPCYVCKTEISTKAILCPKCGEPLWKWKLPFLKEIGRWLFFKPIIILVYTLVLIVSIIYAFFKSLAE